MGANAQTSVPLFVANSVLTAAQQNISAATGIPVFATTVTRDAAFGGSNKVLAEGQLCYLESTDVVQYYTGAAWATVGPSSSSGLVSVAPTSVGKTGASSTATASTNGQVTFALCETLTLNGVFTSAYSNYRILFAGLASGNPSLQARLSVGGTASSAATYQRQQLISSSTTVSALRDSNQTFWIVANNINTTEGDNMSMDIFNPQVVKNTSFTSLSHSTTAGAYWQSVAGYFSATTSFDGIQLFPTSGTMSGIVTVYGYNQ